MEDQKITFCKIFFENILNFSVDLLVIVLWVSS